MRAPRGLKKVFLMIEGEGDESPASSDLGCFFFRVISSVKALRFLLFLVLTDDDVGAVSSLVFF